MKKVERIPERVVAEVRRIEDHPEAIDLPDQFAPARIESTTGVGPIRIHARPIMRGTNRPQSVGE